MLQLRREKRQRQLFEEAPAAHARLHLPVSVQEQLRQTLVQWMQTLAKSIHKLAQHASSRLFVTAMDVKSLLRGRNKSANCQVGERLAARLLPGRTP